jgi:hypothetical protein
MTRNNADFQAGVAHQKDLYGMIGASNAGTGINHHVGPTPTHYSRWMHHDEYLAAQSKGHFKVDANVSPGDGETSYNGGSNWVKVQFPHIDGVFKEKESYAGPGGRAAWMTEPVPFELGKIVGAGGETLAKKYGVQRF